MKYVGPLYGKIGRRYVPLEHNSEYYDNVENKINQLKKAYNRFNDIWGNGGEVNDTDISFLLDAVEDLFLRSEE